MTYIDDFVANPASNSAFQSYPPAMSLIQYFLQKIYFILNPSNGFSEWRAYLAYQITTVSLVFPFFKNLSFKRPFEIILSGVIIFILPLPFYSKIYTSVYIDPFVGVLAGCGFLAVLMGHGTKYNLLYISCICMTLVLTKDVGMFFACFIAVAFFLCSLKQIRSEKNYTSSLAGGKFLLISLLPLLCTLAVKYIWKKTLVLSGAKIIFGGKVKILEFLEMFFLKNDDTVNQTIVENFKWALFQRPFTIGDTNISVSYFALLIITMFLTYVLCRKLIKDWPERYFETYIVETFLLVMPICYIVGLGATYISNFSESEGLALASYSRYIKIVFLATWVFLILGTFILIENTIDKSKIKVQIVSLTVILILCSPVSGIVKLLNRDSTEESQNIRWEYENIAQKIHEHCNGNDSVYFVAKGDSGFAYWVSKFNARPNSLGTPEWVSYWAWDMQNEQHKELSASEWKELLVNDFDYVALYNIDDEFITQYGNLFKSPEKITDQSIFYINKETGLLEFCE